MNGSVKKGGMSCTKSGGKKMSVSHKKKSMRKRGGMSCTKHGGKRGGMSCTKHGGMSCTKHRGKRGGMKGKTMKRRKSQKKSKSLLQRLGF